MGVLKQGILGGFSGKVANIIGTSWKGISVIKAMPLSVANPKTAAQVAQRTLFKNASLFSIVILAVVIKPLWDRFAIKMSGFNGFVKTNINLFAGALPSPAADLIISKGKMASTVISDFLTNAGTDQADLEWVDDSGEGYKLGTDIPYAVVVNETQNIVISNDGITDGSTRADGRIDLSLTENSVAGDVLNGYLAFKRADGTVVSNTSFDTVVVA